MSLLLHSTGLPRRMKSSFTPCSHARASMILLQNSLPLSTVMDSGYPLSAVTLSKAPSFRPAASMP